MNRRRRIYEGKAKILYEGPEPGTIVQHFKDDATAFNAKKHEIIDGKGVLNNRISEHIFSNLNAIGIPTAMFPVMFAIGRVPGWIAHWKEMRAFKPPRIGRPRQIYTGPAKTTYVPMDQR